MLFFNTNVIICIVSLLGHCPQHPQASRTNQRAQPPAVPAKPNLPGARRAKVLKLNLNLLKRQTPENWSCLTGLDLLFVFSDVFLTFVHISEHKAVVV